MPVYEYKCAKCGKHFDVRQKFSDEPLTIHEDCGGELEKLISSPAFHFKGTGWYVTDYAKTNGNSNPDKNAAKAEGGGETKSDSKQESKQDSKSEAKSETKSESKPASPAPATTSSESK